MVIHSDRGDTEKIYLSPEGGRLEPGKLYTVNVRTTDVGKVRNIWAWQGRGWWSLKIIMIVLSDRVLGNLSCLYFGYLVYFHIAWCRGRERKIKISKWTVLLNKSIRWILIQCRQTPNLNLERFFFVFHFGMQRNRAQTTKKVMNGTQFVIFCFVLFTPKIRGNADKASRKLALWHSFHDFPLATFPSRTTE